MNEGALPDVRLRGAAAAVVSGSGLAVVPDGVVVEGEIGYGRLGWRRAAGPAGLRASAPVRGLELRRVGTSARRPGALGRAPSRADQRDRRSGAGLDAGTLLVADEVVDLQTAPHDAPVRLAATAAGLCAAACAALGRQAPVRRGRYVAVAGPHYETPAEAAWLAGLGDAVGMSAAPELRAAARHGLETVVVSCIVNRSGEPVGHADVVTAGGRLAGALAPALGALLTACWPDVFAARERRRGGG